MGNFVFKAHEIPGTSGSPPQKLYCRPHVNWMYYVTLGSCIFLLLTLLREGALALSGRIDPMSSGVIFPLIAVLIFYSRAWIHLRSQALSFVQIFPERIELNRSGKIIEFRFSEITAIRFSHWFPLGNGFLIVSKGKGPYRFTVAFERSEAILDAIMRANPSLVSPQELLRYRNIAVGIDHARNRVSLKLKAWPSLLFKYLGYPMAITGVFFLFAKVRTPTILIFISLAVFVTNQVIGLIFSGVEKVMLDRRFHEHTLTSSSYGDQKQESEQFVQKKIQIAHYCFTVTIFSIIIAYFRDKF